MFTSRMKKLQKSALVATLLISIPTCLVYSSPKTVVKQIPFKGQSGGVITTVGFDPIKLIAYTHVEGKEGSLQSLVELDASKAQPAPTASSSLLPFRAAARMLFPIRMYSKEASQPDLNSFR